MFRLVYMSALAFVLLTVGLPTSAQDNVELEQLRDRVRALEERSQQPDMSPATPAANTAVPGSATRVNPPGTSSMRSPTRQ